jgi:hypothetical protein
MSHLEWMFLRSQESLVVAPPLYQGEPACPTGGMGQGVHNILQKKKHNQ